MSLPEIFLWLAFWLFILAELWVRLLRSVLFLSRASYRHVRSGAHNGQLIWLALLTAFIARCWYLAA